MLSAAPACTVLYELQPDSETAALLDRELDAALRAAWRDAKTARTAVVALLDVSESTAAIRDRLCDLARHDLNAFLFACSPESRVLLFAGGIAADTDVWDFLGGAIDCKANADGTDIEGALYAALDKLADSPLAREIWLFTDGQGSLAVDELAARLRQARTRLRVWEAAPTDEPSLLSGLAAAAGGDYRRIQ